MDFPLFSGLFENFFSTSFRDSQVVIIWSAEKISLFIIKSSLNHTFVARG